MPLESLELVAVLPVPPERIYEAWLDSQEHTAFTGGNKAEITPGVGGSHSAWDGYIRGQNLVLEPARRIIQSWRTSEFPAGHPDSRLEVVLEPHDDGTRMTLRHTDIPEGQGSQYESGWREYYLQPMAKYFAGDEGTVTPLEAVESAVDEAVEEVLEQTLELAAAAIAKRASRKTAPAASKKARAKPVKKSKKKAKARRSIKKPVGKSAAAKKSKKKPAKKKAAPRVRKAAKSKKKARTKGRR